jgi:UDP-N-acetylmuramyl pentapeptide phosphotransferase/UDP-N-acetylglucosamine-1-phosphate transferase
VASNTKIKHAFGVACMPETAREGLKRTILFFPKIILKSMWIYFLIAFLLLIAELFYFELADHFNIIDKPNKRSSHKQITLRGGGIIFYLGVVFYFLLEGFMYPWFFVGLTLITFISFADDVKPRSFRRRIFYHFVAMSLMFYQLGLFQMPGYYFLATLVFCTGVLNAYNFMDGINGITGGYSIVVIASLLYINTFEIGFIDNNLIYIIMVALLVFCFFNCRKKAKCFSGDVGSISIAFVILFMLVSLVLKTRDLSYILLLGLYGVDSILTIIHRIMLRENIFKPHRKHMYQIMANELKMPHLLVSGIYCLMQALITFGLIMVEHTYWYMYAVIAVLCGVYVWFMRRYFMLQKV